MQQTAITVFENTIAEARSKYASSRLMAVRTHKALREAIGVIYALLLRMQHDQDLRDALYRALRAQDMRVGNDEVLLVIEYAFFPDVLRRPDPNNKTDITKAGSYGELIRDATAANILPTDFVRFAGERAAKKTALAKAKAKAKAERNATQITAAKIETGEPLRTGSSLGKKVRPAVEEGDNAFVGEVCFASTAVAREAAAALEAAKAARQVIRVTLITSPERHEKVIVGFKATRFLGPFPAITPLDNSFALSPAADTGAPPNPLGKSAIRSKSSLRGKSPPRGKSPLLGKSQRRIRLGSPPPWPWQR